MKNTSIARLLKEGRKRMRYTQDSIGESTGILRATVASYEEGRAMPPLDNLLKLFKHLEIDILEIIGEERFVSDYEAKNPAIKDIKLIFPDGTSEFVKGNNIMIGEKEHRIFMKDSVKNNLVAVVPSSVAVLYAEKNNNEESLKDIELAVEVTGLSKSRIYQLVGKNAIPYTKASGKLFFCREDLITWLKLGRENKTPQK